MFTFDAGTIIKTTENYRNVWVCLTVTQDMVGRGSCDLLTDKPGLFLFSGLWYGEKDPSNPECYGKAIAIEDVAGYEVIGQLDQHTDRSLFE